MKYFLLNILAIALIIVWVIMKYDCLGNQTWGYYLIPWVFACGIIFWTSFVADDISMIIKRKLN